MAKLTEALKERKNNQKKVLSVTADIQKYASITSNEKPSFDSEKAQKDYVTSLVQSGFDLLERRTKLKVMIDKTNLNTMIKIPKGIVTPSQEITLTEALMFKTIYNEHIAICNALNKTAASTKLRGMSMNTSGEKVTEIQLYDEAWKNNKIHDLKMKLDIIDNHLDMLNVNTDIIE